MKLNKGAQRKMAERKINWIAFFPIIIFAGLVAMFFLPGLLRNDPSAIPTTREGKPAPSLFQSENQGPFETFTDATLREPGVKLVNFWASWCPPCRAEHPNLVKLAKDGLPIYGINYKDKLADSTKFLSSLGNPFTKLLIDDKGRNGIEWGVVAMPESYLIDSTGTILWHFRGPITQRVIDQKLRPLIDAAK